MKRAIERLVVTLCAAVAAGATAHAQKFPAKPVRMIVLYAAGGLVDLVGRLVAQRLTERWGQQAVVENRGGSGGALGADVVAGGPGEFAEFARKESELFGRIIAAAGIPKE